MIVTQESSFTTTKRAVKPFSGSRDGALISWDNHLFLWFLEILFYLWVFLFASGQFAIFLDLKNRYYAFKKHERFINLLNDDKNRSIDH